MLVAEISDHNGITCKIRIGERKFSPVNYIWRVNSNFLASDKLDLQCLEQKYKYWPNHKHKYSDIIAWWVKFLQLKKYIKWKTNEFYREINDTINFWNNALYKLINKNPYIEQNYIQIEMIKAILIKLHKENLNKIKYYADKNYIKIEQTIHS